MEGEDPVAVLSDLELLLRLTEPAPPRPPPSSRTANRTGAPIVLAGAGHTPPLVIGERRTEFVETTLSAPLGMLACWEAPSVELIAARRRDGAALQRRAAAPHRRTMDRAFARLHAAAAGVPKVLRQDPEPSSDHILRTVLPATARTGRVAEDVVLLAARFD